MSTMTTRTTCRAHPLDDVEIADYDGLPWVTCRTCRLPLLPDLTGEAVTLEVVYKDEQLGYESVRGGVLEALMRAEAVSQYPGVDFVEVFARGISLIVDRDGARE